MVNRVVSGILIALGYIGLIDGIGLWIWDKEVLGVSGLGWIGGGLATLISGAIWYYVAKSMKKLGK